MPARFRITSVTSQRLRANVRKGGRVRVKHGRPLTIRGQLVLSAGQPLAGVPITVTTTSARSGRRAVVEATGTVGANGRFVDPASEGSGAAARDLVPGRPGRLPAERRLSSWSRPPARSRRPACAWAAPGRVRFNGRIRDGARANLVVVLQGLERGRWRTFADARTGKAGRWRASYRFSGLAGSYPIRVRIRRAGEPALRHRVLQARHRARALTHRTIRTVTIGDAPPA